MDDIDGSLEEFDEYLDGHFGETALPPKSSYRWRDDALPEVNGHKVNEHQLATLQGRKLVVHARAAEAPEPILTRRAGSSSWRPDGYGHPVAPYPGKPCPITEYAKANPVRSNLRIPTPRLPDLGAGEEAKLIGEAQCTAARF
jgi:hypothetical protein